VAADQENGVTVHRVPLRILHLRDSPWIDGPGRTILETASSIDRSRFDYRVAAFVDSRGNDHPLVDALLKRDLPVHAIVDDGRSLRRIVQQVMALVEAHSIDVLHTSEFRSSLVGLLCRCRFPVLHVRTAHGWIANDLRGRLKAFLDRALLRSCDRVILVSHALRKQLPLWWVPERRVRVLHNAVVLDHYENIPRRMAPSAMEPGAETVLLSVGRLSPEKGQASLLKALARLASRHPGLRVSFAGVGPLERDLRELADSLGVSKRVKFLGYVEDIASVYLSASLVIQSSSTEGLPNVILEAACLEVPVVATDVGGTAEVIEHGVTGWLVRPNSIEDLIAGIEHFLENPARFADMAKLARARVWQDFSFEERTEAQSRLYEELCEART
jgi:glycosyltransferase involved in cell wall biosynthesis